MAYVCTMVNMSDELFFPKFIFYLQLNMHEKWKKK